MNKGHTIKVLDKGYVRFIDNFGDDKRIVESARISYKSPSKGDEQDKKLLFYLWKNRHTSPFEQNSITYNIKLPLFVQAHLVRHRTQRLNQVSARYTEMVDEFYIPKEWRKQDTKNKQSSVNDKSIMLREHYESLTANTYKLTEALEDICKNSYELYQKMLESGVSREMARMVLPQNLYTEIYSNWDLNNLMKFFSLRINDHAQEETRVYAQAMYDIFKELYPWCAEAYEKYKWKLIE
jgi:thymidylate synthase (FAD)